MPSLWVPRYVYRGGNERRVQEHVRPASRPVRKSGSERGILCRSELGSERDLHNRPGHCRRAKDRRRAGSGSRRPRLFPRPAKCAVVLPTHQPSRICLLHRGAVSQHGHGVPGSRTGPRSCASLSRQAPGLAEVPEAAVCSGGGRPEALVAHAGREAREGPQVQRAPGDFCGREVKGNAGEKQPHPKTCAGFCAGAAASSRRHDRHARVHLLLAGRSNCPERPRLLSLLRRRDCRAGHRRSEEHTSELQSLAYLVCRLLLEKKKKKKKNISLYTSNDTQM